MRKHSCLKFVQNILIRKYGLFLLSLFFFSVIASFSPQKSYADCVTLFSQSPFGTCQADGLGCVGDNASGLCSSEIGRPNLYTKWNLVSRYPNGVCSSDRPSLYGITQYCCAVGTAPNGCDVGSGSGGPSRTQVWVRVLSRDGPNGKPISWKGSQSNDGVWTSQYNGLGPVWSNGGSTFNGTQFTTYKGTEDGSTKTWDTARNKVDGAMNFSLTKNIYMDPVEFQTDRREYWSNHFCIRGQAIKDSGSNPPRLQSETQYGRTTYCELDQKSASGQANTYYCERPDVDGCWNPAVPSAGDDSQYDIYGSNLKRLMDKAIDSPSRGDTSWMDLRFDEYWSLNFTTWADEDTEFVLTPPSGYRCKDVRWFKNNNSTTDELIPGTGSSNEYQIENLANGNCRVHSFEPSDDGNMFIFEVEPTATPVTTITVGGRVVNSRTLAGISNVTVRVEKVNCSSNCNLDVVTNSNGYYSAPNFITTTERYNVRVLTGSVSGYLGTGFAINYAQPAGLYIKRGFERIGWTWNNGSGVDTMVGDGAYLNQQAGNDCSGPNYSQGNATNRCWFAFDPPYTVGGRIIDPRTAGALSTSTVLQVRVDRVDNVTSNILASQIVGVDPQGYFSVSNFIRFSDKYQVFVSTTNPVGYMPNSYAINHNHIAGSNVQTGAQIGYSWWHNPTTIMSGRNGVIGDTSYANQKPGGYDCTGPHPSFSNTTNRCWFAFNAVPPPPTIKIAGNVKVAYGYANPIEQKARYNEFGTDARYEYEVEVLKIGAQDQYWQTANWTNKGTNDCSANFPDGADKPNCGSYFTSLTPYRSGEEFKARIRLPNNKYSCIWTVIGSYNGGVTRAVGTVTSENGATYCVAEGPNQSFLRVEPLDMNNSWSSNMEGPVHINFTLGYNSNRVRGKVFDVNGSVISPALSGLQIKKIYRNNTGSNFFVPATETGASFGWPAVPTTNDSVFADYFKPNEKVGFSLRNDSGTYRCGWILETLPTSTVLKTTLSQFGAGFNPADINTYPAQTARTLVGLSSNCLEDTGAITILNGSISPLYQNNLYIFRIEKLNRFSGAVHMRYTRLDGNGVTQDVNVNYTENGSTSLPFETSSYNTATGAYTPWISAQRNSVSNPGCAAKYPNNTAANNGIFGMSGTCGDYFVSTIQFPEGGTIRGLARTIYKAGKYNCSWSFSGGPLQAGTIVPTSNGLSEYCIAGAFDILPDTTATRSINTPWPSHVSFKLTPKENAITNTVFDKGTVSTAFTPTATDSSGTKIGQLINSSSGRRYFIMPYDNGDGWLDGSTVLMGISGTPANKSCYYLAKSGITTPYPAGNIDLVASANDWAYITGDPSFNPAKSPAARFSLDCNNMPITIGSGDYSPIYHNQFYTFVVPKLTIGPSTVAIVDSSAQCSEVGTVVSQGITVAVHKYFGDMVGSGDQSFPNGNFDFPTYPLEYNTGNYDVGISVDGLNLSDYGICPTPTNPSGQNPVPIDLPSLLPNYPNITDDEATIDASIKFYKKDANQWWQVYNGGVYVAEGNLTLNSTATGEGMPDDAVIVGDGNASVALAPNHHVDSIGYVGALVSPDSISPASFDQYGLSGKNWGLLGNAKKMTRLDLDTAYEIAESEWKDASTFEEAATDDEEDATFVSGNDVNIDSEITYSRDRNKIIMVSNGSGNSTLHINANVSKSGAAGDEGLLIVFVRGNVIIDPAVTDLRMVIYATGTINIPTAGVDSDSVLFVTGALYSESNVTPNRDLPDLPIYEKLPSTKVSYGSGIFNNMEDIGSVGFPSVLTESKAFWVIEE